MTIVNGIDLDVALRLIRRHIQPGDTLGKMFMRVALKLEALDCAICEAEGFTDPESCDHTKVERHSP